jgi:transcriptional regulator with XRE-family HTH domain
MNIYHIIAAKIRDLRTHHHGKGISQDALAEAMGTTPNTISRWETATYKPSVEDLEKMACFFGVPLSVFFPGVEPTARVQALLSATGDLDDSDFDELTRYAQFRKARKTIEAAKATKRKKHV